MLVDKFLCALYNCRRPQGDEDFMRTALCLAERARRRDEVPVGAVLVRAGKIIAVGGNRRERGRNALAHAELEAIGAGCKRLRSWRLEDCTLYVTLEPCPMCAGAIVNSRLERVVFGAYDPKAGAAGSVFNLFQMPLNHKPELTGGVLAQDCGQILTDFFRGKRNKKKQGG
ncbi:MAG: tRNA adenosine(34) deaminase TadA [Clostridium sp.]|jgi:tRNA(adenine34) deaminase|nr:tRNA adenosine(34) deaminase TadA [Clostridium sp.]